MDPEPAAVLFNNIDNESTAHKPLPEDELGDQPEDPLISSAPTITLIGFTIAFAIIVVPLTAVFTARSFKGVHPVPSLTERSNGSQSSTAIPGTRISEFGS